MNANINNYFLTTHKIVPIFPFISMFQPTVLCISDSNSFLKRFCLNFLIKTLYNLLQITDIYTLIMIEVKFNMYFGDLYCNPIHILNIESFLNVFYLK